MLDFDCGGVGRGPRDARLTLSETFLPLPAPKPVDALRQHTRAVVLISADGEASPSLLDAIRDSEIPCELIGHPVVAMAELVRLEKDNRLHAERTALFVADDERIEQLSPLFASVRARLPQVAIWVIAGEFAVQVQRATVQDPVGSQATHGPLIGQASLHAPVGSATPPRTRTQGGPVLRIVDHAEDDADRSQSRTTATGGSDHADFQRADPLRSDPLRKDSARTDSPRTDRAVEVKSSGSEPRRAHPEHQALDADDTPSDPDSGAHSTKLTAEELDMLLGWDEQDPSEQGPTGDGGRR
jgi:hypothetical protein